MLYAMTLDQVKKHFGTIKAAAQSIGCHRNTLLYWQAQGVIPWRRQLEIERATNGALRAVKPR